uniref:Uncharacterized protein n=1 Tax=Sphenodon punctatus TaxID=8508 RepID=A0A8D0H4P6_SPHPU
MALWEGIAPVELERGPAAPRILVTDCAVDMQEAPAWHELVEGLPGPDPVTASPEPGEKGADGITEPELEPDALDDGGSSLGRSPVSLEPLEKEWLQGAARGHLSLLRQLLQQEPALAGKKDFTSVSTALHWAAKHGEEDMAALLLNAGADPNMRAHVSLSVCLSESDCAVPDALLSLWNNDDKVGVTPPP